MVLLLVFMQLTRYLFAIAKFLFIMTPVFLGRFLYFFEPVEKGMTLYQRYKKHKNQPSNAEVIIKNKVARS